MGAKKQAGKTHGIRKNFVDGVVLIWQPKDINPKYDDNSFSYKIIVDPNSDLHGSIFGPHPDYFRRDSFERRVIERVESVLASHDYIFFKVWQPLAEYRPVS